MWRNTIQVAKLVNSHAQSDANLRIGRAWNTASDQIVELRLIPQAPEDDFGSEPGVTRIKLCRLMEQEVRSIAAFVYFAQNIESDLSRRRDQFLF